MFAILKKLEMSVEGDDKKKDPEPLYYMENGLIVFTAAYHLKRGYCCKRGCRHCPYGFKKESNDKLERR